MDEYISREKALNEILGEFPDAHYPDWYASIIRKIPAADVVEVVRCKDCKHATFYSCRNDTCYKGILCEYEIGTVDENFFCSYGEKREEK